jgi:hypothetical protein
LGLFTTEKGQFPPTAWSSFTNSHPPIACDQLAAILDLHILHGVPVRQNPVFGFRLPRSVDELFWANERILMVALAVPGEYMPYAPLVQGTIDSTEQGVLVGIFGEKR